MSATGQATNSIQPVPTGVSVAPSVDPALQQLCGWSWQGLAGGVQCVCGGGGGQGGQGAGALSHWFGAGLEGQNVRPGCAGHFCGVEGQWAGPGPLLPPPSASLN